MSDWRTWLSRVCCVLWLHYFEFCITHSGVVILSVFILQVTPQIAVNTTGIWVDLPGGLAMKMDQKTHL